MKRGEERRLRIRAIRDIAIAAVRKVGRPVVIKNVGGRGFEAHLDGFSIGYLTPFQKLPEPSEYSKYVAAKHGIVWRAQPPYLLDIWLGRKVFSVTWSRNEEIETICFKRGEWEAKFISLAESVTEPLVGAPRSMINDA
jgi:hypothetical protein